MSLGKKIVDLGKQLLTAGLVVGGVIFTCDKVLFDRSKVKILNSEPLTRQHLFGGDVLKGRVYTTRTKGGKVKEFFMPVEDGKLQNGKYYKVALPRLSQFKLYSSEEPSRLMNYCGDWEQIFPAW